MKDTCYGPIANVVIEKAAKIKLLICDVDGVMSDGIGQIWGKL